MKPRRSSAAGARTTRAVAYSTDGMVAAPHAAASAAGADVLRRGGNAIDAAVAANAVLAVVYPASCGIGGDLLAVVYEPKTGETIAYNGSGRAPSALSGAMLRDRGLTAMPVRGAFTITTPGCVRAWEDVLAAHGSRELGELLPYGERYAREGFSATATVANYIALNASLLAADEDAAAIFLRDGVPAPGDRLRNLPLADCLREIGRRGSRAFYEGHIAEAIASTVRAAGNPMTVEDLAAQTTERVAPVRVPWNGCEVAAHPPNSQAAVAAIALGMLEGDGGANDADWTHLAIEALKFAFDERDARFAEPAAMPAPIDDLLAPAALHAMRARIDPERARARIAAPGSGGTIGIVAIDGEGRAISLIESLYMNFGSGIVARGTGIFLQNRGAYFSLEAGHPNELGGRKRPLHTLSPGMLLRGGKPEFVYATMGGDGQPQTHVQLVHNVYERGMDVQEAIDAPRFVYGRDSESAFADRVTLESRFSDGVVRSLRARGHDLDIIGPYENKLGHAHGIVVDRERGVYAGGSDPRADSLALGV